MLRTTKKILLIGVIITMALSMFALSGCGNNFATNYFMHTISEDYETSQIRAVTSIEEMNTYIEIAKAGKFGDTNLTYINIVTERYNVDFFINTYIVIVALTSTSSRHSFRFHSVRENGDIIISASRSSGGMDIVTYFRLILELENSFQPNSFNVIVN